MDKQFYDLNQCTITCLDEVLIAIADLKRQETNVDPALLNDIAFLVWQELSVAKYSGKLFPIMIKIDHP